MLFNYTNNTLTYLPDEAVRGVMKLLLGKLMGKEKVNYMIAIVDRCKAQS